MNTHEKINRDNKCQMYLKTETDEEIELTQTQFELLTLFIKNPNIVFSREKIIESIWGYTYEAEDRTIDAHIKLLRNKIGK